MIKQFECMPPSVQDSVLRVIEQILVNVDLDEAPDVVEGIVGAYSRLYGDTHSVVVNNVQVLEGRDGEIMRL